jgi:hypothetical protein
MKMKKEISPEQQRVFDVLKGQAARALKSNNFEQEKAYREAIKLLQKPK